MPGIALTYRCRSLPQMAAVVTLMMASFASVTRGFWRDSTATFLVPFHTTHFMVAASSLLLVTVTRGVRTTPSPACRTIRAEPQRSSTHHGCRQHVFDCVLDGLRGHAAGFGRSMRMILQKKTGVNKATVVGYNEMPKCAVCCQQ